MNRWSILDLFQKLGARPYDWFYRRGAPWESGPRPYLVEMVESGRVPPGTGLDLGCGSGADSIFLAQHGFAVTGADFSEVAIDKARTAAAGMENLPEFVVADLLTLPSEAVPGPFDLIFDGGSIDDFPPRMRHQIAEVVTGLSRPGSVLLSWSFYAAREDQPWMSTKGQSRIGAPPIEPGEMESLFPGWEIEIAEGDIPGSATFFMTKL